MKRLDFLKLIGLTSAALVFKPVIGATEPLTIPLKGINVLDLQMINPTVLKKYLIKAAYELVNTPVQNTVVEYVEEGTLAERKLYNVQHHESCMIKQVKHVQFLQVITKGKEVTEDDVKRMCGYINVMVEQGDLIIGCLMQPFIMPLTNGKQSMMFYPVGNLTKDQLNAKYPKSFFNEGELIS